MIISDAHEFVFVHIPKCAGTSVRKVLAPYDSYEGWFDQRVDTHPVHGRLDYVHLPLALLREVMPQEYAKVRDYHAYALVRDPLQRFQSAFAQYTKMYRGVELAQMEDARVRDEIDALTERLRGIDIVFPPELIHFSRQESFLHDPVGGAQVEHVYPVARLDRFMEDLSARIGAPLSSTERANQTQVLRSPFLREPVVRGRKMAEALMPPAMFRTLRRLGRSTLMRPVQDRVLPVFDTPAVTEFVKTHYARDIEIFNAAERAHH